MPTAKLQVGCMASYRRSYQNITLEGKNAVICKSRFDLLVYLTKFIKYLNFKCRLSFTETLYSPWYFVLKHTPLLFFPQRDRPCFTLTTFTVQIVYSRQ
jgi:hypothetical protein